MNYSSGDYSAYSKGDFTTHSKERVHKWKKTELKKQWMATEYDYNDLGEIYLANCNFLDAKKAYLKAREINPKYIAIHIEIFKIFDTLISMNKKQIHLNGNYKKAYIYRI